MGQLKHRVPVRLRQNWKLVAVCAAFLAVCAGVFGSGTIRPYITTTQAASADTVTTNLTGTKELFDTSVPHDVKITFTDQAYEDMLTEYFKEGEKKYVEADLTIDGTRIPSVGVRLKGNSTLSGLTWKGESRRRGVPAGGPPEGMRLPDGVRPGEGFPAPEGQERNGQGPEGQERNGQGPEGQERKGQGPGGAAAQDRRPPGAGGMFGSSLKAEEPENLPWLISFDEFVEGRRYQGHTQVAVRPAAMQSTTLLNEALAISTVSAAGEPSQRYAYSSFEVNGRGSAPRLLIEYLDEGYAERLGNGVLYKSLASSTFTYKGEDQTEYTADFKQINKIGGKDLQPVIDLIRWVEQSSDAEFAAHLADRVDVPSFARYLALQNLMTNFDDMSGPGRNYYLWYDLGTKRFTVVTWDLNFAFTGDATTGAGETVSMSPGGGGPGGRPQDGQEPNVQQQGRPPQGFPAPDGPRQDGGGGPGMMRMGHLLKERFLKTPALKKIYEEQYRDLYRKLLADGVETSLLDDIVVSYKLNRGADGAKADAEADSLRATLKTRTETLRADKVTAVR